jgi:hypothetical protein
MLGWESKKIAKDSLGIPANRKSVEDLHELRKDGWRFTVEMVIIICSFFGGSYVTLTTANPEIRTAAVSALSAALGAVLQKQSTNQKS